MVDRADFFFFYALMVDWRDEKGRQDKGCQDPLICSDCVNVQERRREVVKGVECDKKQGGKQGKKGREKEKNVDKGVL